MKQNEQELEAMYHEHADLVYRYLLSLGADYATAQDLLMETFYKLRKAHGFSRGMENPTMRYM